MDLDKILGAGTLGALVTGVLTHYLTKRKFNAEVDREITETVKSLLNMAQEEASRQKAHRDACEHKVEELQRELAELRMLINQGRYEKSGQKEKSSSQKSNSSGA